MSDWLGILFLVTLAVAAFLGIRALANPKPRTTEEFEKNAAENSTMLGASMNALHELMNPEAAKAKEVQMQMKDGRYGKKKRGGKSSGGADIEES
jgi:hypothetical protein